MYPIYLQVTFTDFDITLVEILLGQQIITCFISWKNKSIKDQHITRMISTKTQIKKGSLPGDVAWVLTNLCCKVLN